MENLRDENIIYLKKTLTLSIVYSMVMNTKKKIKEKLIEILKIVGLINNIDEYQKVYNHA